MAEIAEGGMAVDDLYLFTDKDLSENREGREHRGEGGATVDDPVREMVDFDAVGKVADPRPAGIGVGDDYYFVAAVDEFLQGCQTGPDFEGFEDV